MLIYFKGETNHYYSFLITEIVYIVLLALILYVVTIVNNGKVKKLYANIGVTGYLALTMLTTINIVYNDFYKEMDFALHLLTVVLPAFGLAIAGNRLDKIRYLARAKNQEPFTRNSTAQPFLRNPYTDLSMVQVLVALITWVF